MIPQGLVAIYDRSTWTVPQEMKFLADVAGVPRADMERTWNCGIGMSAIVAPDAADLILRSLAARGMKAWIAGTVELSGEIGGEAGSPRSQLTSDYRP